MPPVRAETNGISYAMHRRFEHVRPHLHIYYGEFAASVALDSLEVLAGKLPRKQQAEALAWIALHQQELLAMWPNRMQQDGIYKIKD